MSKQILPQHILRPLQRCVVVHPNVLGVKAIRLIWSPASVRWNPKSDVVARGPKEGEPGS
jgi:hypothetical protein